MSTPDRDPHELAVQSWVAATTGLTTVFVNQDGPRPSIPYCTLAFLSDIGRGGRPQVTQTDTPDGDDYVEHTDHGRSFTCTVTVYGDACRSVARDLGLAIRGATAQETFGAQTPQQGRILRAISEVAPDVARRGIENEPFAVIDLEGTFVATRADRAGSIESAELTDSTTPG